MAEQRQIFLTRAQEQKFDGKKAGELFDLMAYFAGYGFNKSHSAAYALIAYQTAYLKANYAAEFMACLISLESSDAEKMAFYLQEARDMSLEILPPDVNRSHIAFCVIDGKILFGLQGIKNVGLAALENIIAQREKGPFTDLFDFCKRVDLRTANKRVIENLICAGACDSMPGNRAQKFHDLSVVMERAAAHKKDLATGQMGLFGLIANTPTASNEPGNTSLEMRAEWSDKEKLDREKEVIGFYLSAHPLATYKKHLARIGAQQFAHILEKSKNHSGQQEMVVIACGILKSKKEIITKKGDRMAFLHLEDTSGQAEIILFPKPFAKAQQWFTDEHQVFVIKGGVDLTATVQCKIKANDLVPLEKLFDEWPTINKACMTLPAACDATLLETMRSSLQEGSIPLELIVHENDKKLRITTAQKITLDHDSALALEQQGVTVRVEL
jgi:DNA polymerase-3 subunit alpha